MNDIERIAKLIVDNFLVIIPFFFGIILLSIFVSKIIKITLKHIDLSTANFLSSLVQFLILFSSLPVILWYFEFDKTKIWALIAILSTATALAITSKITDLVSGVVIYLMRFYRINDKVSLNGIKGKVVEFNIFNTILKTRDGDIVTIRNSNIVDKSIINHSESGFQRLVIRLEFVNLINHAQTFINLIKIVNNISFLIRTLPIEINYGFDATKQWYDIECFIPSEMDAIIAKGRILYEISIHLDNFHLMVKNIQTVKLEDETTS